MSPSATPATQSAAASPATNPVQARHQSQPSALSATPATENESRCHEVLHLRRGRKADVAKCQACHAKCRGVTGDQSSPSAPPEPAQCPKCHTCHAKRRWMSPSGTPCHVKRRQMSPKTTPATQSATGNENKCHEVLRLPRETKADVAKCHACHAKCREVTRDQSSPSAPPEPAQCPKCHACHAKRRWMSPSATPAT